MVAPGYIWNFYHESSHPVDVEQIFGGFTGCDKVFTFNNSATYEDLAVAAGWFSSKGQARRNGWSGPIPDGWSSGRKIGGQWPVYIYNPGDAHRYANVSHAACVEIEPKKVRIFETRTTASPPKPLSDNQRLLLEFASTRMYYPAEGIE